MAFVDGYDSAASKLRSSNGGSTARQYAGKQETAGKFWCVVAVHCDFREGVSTIASARISSIA